MRGLPSPGAIRLKEALDRLDREAAEYKAACRRRKRISKRDALIAEKDFWQAVHSKVMLIGLILTVAVLM